MEVSPGNRGIDHSQWKQKLVGEFNEKTGYALAKTHFGLEVEKTHLQTFQELKKENGLPQKIKGEYAPDKVKQIVRLLNKVEQETLTGAITSLLPTRNYMGENDIKIGTEFTFTSDDLRNMRVGLSSESRAYPYQDAWKNYEVRQKEVPSDKSTDCVVRESKDLHRRPRWKGQGMELDTRRRRGLP